MLLGYHPKVPEEVKKFEKNGIICFILLFSAAAEHFLLMYYGYVQLGQGSPGNKEMPQMCCYFRVFQDYLQDLSAQPYCLFQVSRTMNLYGFLKCFQKY